MGPKEEAHKALEIVMEQAQKVGLRLNLAKCEVWSEDEAALTDFPAEITRCKPEGFELLGVGIGSQALCEESVQECRVPSHDDGAPDGAQPHAMLPGLPSLRVRHPIHPPGAHPNSHSQVRRTHGGNHQ